MATKFCMVVDVDHIKVNIYVKEKAGGLTPTSSCFIAHGSTSGMQYTLTGIV